MRKSSHRRLSNHERQMLLDTAHSQRFADLSVREIYATLLDEGSYIASISTWYRVLRAVGETRERRRQATHPARVKPELVAFAPGQVWSWDITKLLGPTKWTYYYLYVVLDIFSRYVVAWRLEYRESATLAEEMIAQSIIREGVDPTRLTIHADGGPSMTSKTLAQLYADLGITKSRSRPHVSNDNPFSEAQFKTLKYTRDSRRSLPISNKGGRTAASSFPGTTMIIDIAGSLCLPQAMFIIIASTNGPPPAVPLCIQLGTCIPNGLFAVNPNHPNSNPQPISIDPKPRSRHF